MALQSLLSISRLSTDQRVEVMKALQQRVPEGQAALSQEIEAALAHDALLLDLETRWDSSQERGTAKELDDAIDDVLEALHIALEVQETDAAEAFRTTLFPKGLEHHTSLPFTQQGNANAALLMALNDDDQAAQALGVAGHRDALAPLQARFSQLMTTSDGVQFAEVRDLRSAGREKLARVVFVAVAAFIDDQSTLDDLLEPLMASHRRMERAARKLRRAKSGRR
jgi:hypothetical protein